VVRKPYDPDRARWLAVNILPYEPLVRAWLRRITPKGVEIDDLVQEAYAKLAALPSVKHITQPKPYLFRTVKSLILGHLRHTQIIEFESLAEMGEPSIAAEETSPERIAIGREQLYLLSQHIDELPAGCREVFALRKFEELSQREIAQRLHVSENTVEKQLARAVRLLLAKMTTDDTIIESEEAATKPQAVTGSRGAGA
jgi:RNA polymerase sigma factor (sigma-70 family)